MREPPATLDEFRGLFSESPDPRQWPHIATGVTYRRALAAIAEHLGCETDERAARGIMELPATQAEALDALAADPVLTAALGPVLADSYLAVRRSEWAAYSAGDAAFEQQGHFEKY